MHANVREAYAATPLLPLVKADDLVLCTEAAHYHALLQEMVSWGKEGSVRRLSTGVDRRSVLHESHWHVSGGITPTTCTSVRTLFARNVYAAQQGTPQEDNADWTALEGIRGELEDRQKERGAVWAKYSESRSIVSGLYEASEHSDFWRLMMTCQVRSSQVFTFYCLTKFAYCMSSCTNNDTLALSSLPVLC